MSECNNHPLITFKVFLNLVLLISDIIPASFLRRNILGKCNKVGDLSGFYAALLFNLATF